MGGKAGSENAIVDPQERAFSVIRKNKTAFRPNLDPNETLGSTVTVKMELQNDGPMSKYDFPLTVLSAAKKGDNAL